MIVANVTVYRCDNMFGCDSHFIVSNERDEISFQKRWFVGLTKQFCPEHRNAVRNQAVIIAEEAQIEAMTKRTAARFALVRPAKLVNFKSIQEVRTQNGNAAA